ncbi:HEPN domain-containing protein [Arthrobacter monumenti]
MKFSEQIAHLDETLLTNVTIQFPDVLSERDRAVTHAFLVLAHAVLEERLEDIFQKHFDRLASWLGYKTIPVETARLAFAVCDWLPERLVVGYKQRALPQLISQGARKEFIRLLSSNHGLKSSNVESLSKLVGLDWKDFEDALTAELADLDNLGAKRGAAGHLSPYTDKVTAITANNDPDEIRQWVQAGRKAVEAVEQYLDDLLRSQQPASLISDWDGN